MWRERECGGREWRIGEDRQKVGVGERREKKTEWRMKVDDLF